MDDKDGWGQDQRKRQVVQPAEQGLDKALPEGRRQVIVLAAVMRHMGRPEKVELVAGTVGKVVAQVDAHKAQQPRGKMEGIEVDQVEVLVEERVAVHDHRLAAKLVRELLRDARGDRAKAVVEAHSTMLGRELRRDELDHDREVEERNDGRDVVGHGVHRLERGLTRVHRVKHGAQHWNACVLNE